MQFFITTTTSPMVDWGDGTIEPIAIGNVTPFTTINATPSHTYRSSGDYTIKISGISAFSNYSKKDLYHGKLLSVTDWGGIEWTNMQIMFKYANHLNLFPATGPNMEKVGDMNQMFFGATTFNQSLANFNTENVRDMSEMFYGATEFNQSLLSFNTAKVTDMVSMFNGARAFNQPLLSFNTVNVTDMSTMFVEAIAFNQNISNWCVSLIG